MSDDPQKTVRWESSDDLRPAVPAPSVTEHLTEPILSAASATQLLPVEKLFPRRDLPLARPLAIEPPPGPSHLSKSVDDATDVPEPEEIPPPDSPAAWNFIHAAAEASAGQSESTAESEAFDSEPFDRPDAQKLGIVGGKGVGKTYLFQAMVYRCFAGAQSGALTYYLENDGMHLFTALGEESETGRHLTETGEATTLNRVDFIRKYQRWERLAFTNISNQNWYRLRLNFRTGLFGRARSAMDVEFFDGSGEGLIGAKVLSDEDRALWARAYLRAQVMVFCLPLWAAFPDSDLSDDDWKFREDLISGFEQVVKNYNDMRSRHRATTPVSSVLALTMADDRRRSSLQNLYSRWISPYLAAPQTCLKELRTGTGVARYLNNARKVSEGLHEEFASVADPRIASIPQSLDFGRGVPWVVPLSAMDGTRLDKLDSLYPNPDDPLRLRAVLVGAPVPVHVELPLLVALCERENALM
jgi:hypothetical protein